MKLIGMSCVMLGLMMAGCQKRVVQTEDSSAPNLTASPQMIPAVAAQTTPAPREYAPSGVFYLLTAVRRDTRDGIIRLLPGTEVKLARNGKYITPEGEMTLDPKILTDDMAVARAVRNADMAAQNAAYPKGLPPTPPSAPIAASSSATLSAAASPAAVFNTLFSGTPAQTSSQQQVEGDAQVRAMKFRLSILKKEEAKLQANADYLHEKALSLPHTTGAPTGLSGSTNVADSNLIANKLATVRTEIQTLEQRLGPSN